MGRYAWDSCTYWVLGSPYRYTRSVRLLSTRSRPSFMRTTLKMPCASSLLTTALDADDRVVALARLAEEEDENGTDDSAPA